MREIIVIGSKSILGSFPNAPAELTMSMEADVFPKEAPERSILIDGAIGELSLFHETFGYYAHGVDETTARLPDGWKHRLVKVSNENTRGAIGWCLEPHDLAVSKLVAGREKDLSFVASLLRNRMVAMTLIRERLASIPGLADEIKQNAIVRLARLDVG